MKYRILTTTKFDKWFKSIKDKMTRYRLEARINQVARGNFGDWKPIDSNVNELRFFFAGGVRIYYIIRENEIVLLLNGGDKSTQSRDIATAKDLFSQLGE
ncbi:type II toxin-antitoxin system RelE/ParE family toxin [Thiomicrospira microaerophila]|uniref:type II toxin-antitoxin system RelE/ParE family toxin n=1 Tax=Thiomicrospira microaerophila TaxID=406020 RepID=UPI00200FBFAF|nr:type II toxin-antitoxin system RelE/ParE family toxin [Thiomicrospira microaerophila]UQB43232.1 type II toxin-antitoxin system RelE/ParE family toxin [Thiomicrospira microaerophila]